MDYIKLGQRIKEERIKSGLTQEALGELTEITSSYVGQIERGERKVTLSKLVNIANVLKVSIDYLLLDELNSSDESLNKQICNAVDRRNKNDKHMIIDIIKVIDKYKE